MSNSDYTIVDTKWFGRIGVVKTFNGIDTKFFIGKGVGINIDVDESIIVETGVEFKATDLTEFLNPIINVEFKEMINEHN